MRDRADFIDIEERLNDKPIYTRYNGDALIQTARLKLLGIGIFAFETSLFGEKPYVTNMNMPKFDTEKEAYGWIENSGKWQKEGNNEL
ncbi:MAG: hypothetical protein WC364_10600 [Eubacteriales bacterium]|jgi:hypothetical protein